MLRKVVIATFGVVPILVGCSFVAPAFAEEPDSPVQDAVTAISDVAPTSLEAAATTTGDAENAATYSSELVTAEVSRDAAEGVSLTGLDRDLEISLPFADQASEAVAESGVVAFDNNNGSTTVPVIREDGSVQILTVIDNSAAPTRYDYALSLPEGGAITVDETGLVLVTDEAGNFLSAIAPAWAKDANGEAVSTWYEVNGNVLTQVVEHSAATAYPVVADPWAGIQLFSGFYLGSWGGDYTYNATVTAMGAVVLSGGGGVGGYLAGQAVFRTSGWDEWKAVWAGVTYKATVQQQYECHVTASTYGLPFTGTYNLERARSNYSNWPSNVLSHHCNW